MKSTESSICVILNLSLKRESEERVKEEEEEVSPLVQYQKVKGEEVLPLFQCQKVKVERN